MGDPAGGPRHGLGCWHIGRSAGDEFAIFSGVTDCRRRRFRRSNAFSAKKTLRRPLTEDFFKNLMFCREPLVEPDVYSLADGRAVIRFLWLRIRRRL
jgi:hypothetical protein